MQYIKEEQVRSSTLIHLLLSILIQKPGLAHTINDTGHGYSFLSVKLHWQPIKLLAGKVLEIPLSDPCVCVCSDLGTGLCGLFQIMDI